MFNDKMMNVLSATSLPAPQDLLAALPLAINEHRFIEESRTSIKKILEGKDPRLLLIVGPCSIHDCDAAIAYAKRLSRLSQVVQDRFFLTMRVFVEKPRTCLGWKGMVHDPHLDGSNEMAAGLFAARALLQELAALRLPAAMEFLEWTTPYYLADLVSWGCIGARTVTSQPHRQLASLLPFAVGFKNGVDGQTLPAIHSILAARYAQGVVGIDEEGKATLLQSAGNRWGHLILRGGGGKTNCDSQSVASASHQLREKGLKPRLLVDCAHGNSANDYRRQADNFATLIELVAAGDQTIAGMMLESHIHADKQQISQNLQWGVSITDPCLEWEATESLLLHAHQSFFAALKP
jgi:3-deoxy-7-phosphoheptulonate synthase